GRWKTKTHADVDDSADVLGVGHREIDTLSQGQQRTLEQFGAERAVWHDDQAQAYRDSIDEMGAGLSNVHPGDTDAYVGGHGLHRRPAGTEYPRCGKSSNLYSVRRTSMTVCLS